MTELMLNKIMAVIVIVVVGYFIVGITIDFCKIRKSIKQLQEKINKQEEKHHEL